MKSLKKPTTDKVAKTPVVMQLEALECGAASLAMILAYYDKWIPLEQVRKDCGVSRDGSNAKNVLLAARKYGLNATGYRFEDLDALKKGASFPCIVHWEFNHFIVLCGFTAKYAIVNDPAKGYVKMPIETFDEGFTGIVLLFSPSEAFTPSGQQKSMFEFVKRRLKGTKNAVIYSVLCCIIMSLVNRIDPILKEQFADRILLGKSEHGSLFLCFAAGLCLVELIMMLLQTIYSFRIDGHFAIKGNTSYLWKVLHLPMEFFSQRMVGDLQMRQASNATIANTLVGTLAPLVVDTCMMLFYFVIMWQYSPILSAVCIFTMIFKIWLSKVISQKRLNISRVEMRNSGKLASETVSGIEMIETIKASGSENGFFKKWAGYQAAVNTQETKSIRLDSFLGMLPQLITQFTETMILVIGIFLIMNGDFTIGMLIAFQGFLASFTAPATSLLTAGEMIMEMRMQMERIDDVMEYPSDVRFASDYPDWNASKAGSEPFGKLQGNVDMKNVSFGYSSLAEPLIKDFNLHLEPGKSIAFVGPTGCGKSTLAKLISGLYQPWSGDILFDGKKLGEIDGSIFTGSLAVVDQDIILFEDTIANNIKMWDSSIEDFEMIMAARDAGIHEDIMARKGGYQYKLSEGGKDFSGGQRQRLEIARVLAQDPTIIVLDEATSALDAQTEQKVIKAIKDRGITCIVVAHRLSTIRDCDEIVVLEKGNVVERGTHDELYQMDGAYAKLIRNE